MSSEEYDHVFKIILAGESGVGKSSIIRRYCQDKFKEDEKFTVGIEFRTHVLEIDSSKIKAQIWDTAGNERFRTLTPFYYRNAHGAIIVYDIASPRSFQNVQFWLEDIVKHSNLPNMTIMLLGNKCDLEQIRSVSAEEARKYEEKYNMLFMETSALDSTNIELAFQKILERIYENMKNNTSKNGILPQPTVILEPKPKKKIKCCY